MKDGDRILFRECRECIMGPTQVCIEDPCPFGQPVILTVRAIKRGDRIISLSLSLSLHCIYV